MAPKKSKRLENQGVYLLLVAEAGLEHATSRLWAWRATNCSTPRCNHKQSNRCNPNLNCGCKGTAFGRNHQITERNNERFNSYLTHSCLLRSQAPSIFATNRMQNQDNTYIWNQDNTYLYNKDYTKVKKREYQRILAEKPKKMSTFVPSFTKTDKRLWRNQHYSACVLPPSSPQGPCRQAPSRIRPPRNGTGTKEKSW